LSIEEEQDLALCVATVSLWLEPDDTWLHDIIHSDFLADYEFYISEHSSYRNSSIFPILKQGKMMVSVYSVCLSVDIYYVVCIT
jgi:hypothetical protein